MTLTIQFDQDNYAMVCRSVLEARRVLELLAEANAILITKHTFEDFSDVPDVEDQLCLARQLVADHEEWLSRYEALEEV